MDSTAIPTPTLRRTGLLLGTLLGLVYLPTLIELVLDWWNDPNYSHGFLIPLVSGWLLWRRRSELQAVPVRTERAGLVVLLAAMGLFVVGNAAAEYFTARVSFLIALTGLVWLVLGSAMLRAIWFELFFLLFMIPIPYVLYYAAAVPMQLLASKVTAGLLQAVGMSIVRQGNIIHIPGYSLEVAEACSGIRSMMSLVALGVLFSHFTQPRWAGKVLLFLATIPLAVAGNVFRVLVTTILAALVGDAVVTEPLHTLLGMSVFVVAFIGLFVVGRILSWSFR